MAALQSDSGRHVVIRNTFLEFSDDSTTLESHDPSQPRRVRASSDMTDSKLPMKVELSNSAGFYQISRHRLSSTLDGTAPPSVGVLAGAGNTSKKKNGSPKTSGADKIALPIVLEESLTDFEARPTDSQSKTDLSHLLKHSLQPPILNGSGIPTGCMANLGGMPPPMPLPPQWWAMFGSLGGLQVPPPGILSGPNAQMLQSPPLGDYRQATRSSGIGLNQSHVTDPGSNRLQLAEMLPEKKDNPLQKELTTVMMRHIPVHYTCSMLLELLESSGFHGQYDFVYLPMDFRNGVNLAYAFVNMTSHQDAVRLTRQLHGYTEWGSENCNGYDVSWAHPNQGLQEHVERYRNSPVMHQYTPDEYKPMVFKNGKRVAFPSPTKQIKAPKIKQPSNGRPKGHEVAAKGQEVAHEAQRLGHLGMPDFVAVC